MVDSVHFKYPAGPICISGLCCIWTTFFIYNCIFCILKKEADSTDKYLADRCPVCLLSITNRTSFPASIQILSLHNNAAIPAQGRQFSLLRFNELGLPPAIEANVGHQTKQFTSQAKFDLGPGEIPDNDFLRAEPYTGWGFPFLPLLPLMP